MSQPYQFYNSKSKNTLAANGTLDSIEEDNLSQYGYNTSKYAKSDDEQGKTQPTFAN